MCLLKILGIPHSTKNHWDHSKTGLLRGNQKTLTAAERNFVVNLDKKQTNLEKTIAAFVRLLSSCLHYTSQICIKKVEKFAVINKQFYTLSLSLSLSPRPSAHTVLAPVLRWDKRAFTRRPPGIKGKSHRPVSFVSTEIRRNGREEKSTMEQQRVFTGSKINILAQTKIWHNSYAQKRIVVIPCHSETVRKCGP